AGAGAGDAGLGQRHLGPGSQAGGGRLARAGARLGGPLICGGGVDTRGLVLVDVVVLAAGGDVDEIVAHALAGAAAAGGRGAGGGVPALVDEAVAVVVLAVANLVGGGRDRDAGHVTQGDERLVA